MDLSKSELFYKLKNMINPEHKKKDFSFYVHKIKEIAPLTFELLGEDFLKKVIPLYFKEVQINEENLVENVFYFPIFFKKYQADHEIKDYHVELIDYEFTKYQTENDPTHFELPSYGQPRMEIYLNPVAQAIRHEYDIHEYVINFYKKPSKHLLPKKNKTLLMVSKDPKTQKAIFQKGSMNQAAVIDELYDGKILKKDLLATLQAKYPAIAQSEWIIAIKSLKESFIILEV